MVWFEAEEPEDCKNAPDEVSHEKLPTNICDEVSIQHQKTKSVLHFDVWNTPANKYFGSNIFLLIDF